MNTILEQTCNVYIMFASKYTPDKVEAVHHFERSLVLTNSDVLLKIETPSPLWNNDQLNEVKHICIIS